MDPFTFCLLMSALIVKFTHTVKVSSKYAEQGKTPPSVDLAKRMIDRRGGKGRDGGPAAEPKRPGMSGFFKELWLDLWDDAIDQHKKERKRRKADEERREADKKRREANGEPPLAKKPKKPWWTRWKWVWRWRDTPANEDPGPRDETGQSVCEWCEYSTDDLLTVRHDGDLWLMCRSCRKDVTEDDRDATGGDGQDNGDDTRPETEKPESEKTERRRKRDDQPYQKNDDTHCPGCGRQATRSPAQMADWAAEWRCWHDDCGGRCDTCGEATRWARPAGPTGVGRWYQRHSTLLGDCPGPKPKPEEPDDNAKNRTQPDDDQSPLRCRICLADLEPDLRQRSDGTGRVLCPNRHDEQHTGRKTPDDTDGRHRSPSPEPAGTATGDVTDATSCNAECDQLLDDLDCIDAAVDRIDTAVTAAVEAGERMSAWLQKKNVDQVAGLAALADHLNPDRIRTLIEAVAGAKAGVVATQDGLAGLIEAASLVGDAAGSATNGR